MSDQEKHLVLKQNKRILKEQKEAYSLWCTELYRLSIANKVSIAADRLIACCILTSMFFLLFSTTCAIDSRILVRRHSVVGLSVCPLMWDHVQKVCEHNI